MPILRSKRFLLLLVLLALFAASIPLLLRLPPVYSLYLRYAGRATLEDRLAQHGQAARDRLAPYFRAAGVAYPPPSITLATFKNEEELQVYARSADGYRFIRSYPFTAASGVLGPKLREGDRQVPEWMYRITYLNPNSRFHLSLRVGYPNEQDQQWAKEEGRTSLGGDIMIHGNAVSIGCIAVGDEAAEDLFVLAADVGMKNIDVLISPVDFRKAKLPGWYKPIRPWVPELYHQIKFELDRLPLPGSTS